jgi:hypothetical protein
LGCVDRRNHIKVSSQNIAKGQWIISTEVVSIPSGFNDVDAWSYALEPRILLGTWNGFRMSMTAIVSEPEPGKSKILINVHYEAFENNVTKSWRVCQTTGREENKILDAVQSTIGP